MPTLSSDSPNKSFFIRRLRRMVDIQEDEVVATIMEENPHIRKGLSKAIFSTYEDLVSLGAEEDAKRILGREEELPF